MRNPTVVLAIVAALSAVPGAEGPARGGRPRNEPPEARLRPVPGTGGTGPHLVLSPAPRVDLPADVDSNSPAIWTVDGDGMRLHVFTSAGGAVTRSVGRDVASLQKGERAEVRGAFGGVWLESVFEDEGGVWYGYYHNEVAAPGCEGDDRVAPRIGAARSGDGGATWDDLGIVLEAPAFTMDCDSPNHYFLGGVGDFTVLLDEGRHDLYFFASQYASKARAQGVAVARLPWADRDAPVGRIEVWRDGAWRPAVPVAATVRGGADTWVYPPGTPFFRAADAWNDDNDTVDVFWGPSVHWNTYLRRYVMVLNHAVDLQWRQEGIYVSFAVRLDDPGGWTAPARILDGGRWYPEVLGLERGTGTDRTAGRFGRLFVGGRSDHTIRFER